MASDKDIQIYCQPCDEEGTRLPAYGYCTDCKEHLCKTCFTAHKICRLSKHHVLLNAAKMPKVLQQHSTSIQTDQSDVLNTPCFKHPQKMIKFYCNDHKNLLCSVCVTLEHQATSCKVDYIPHISKDIIDNTQYQDTLKALDKTSDQYKQILRDVKNMTYKSNSSLKYAIEEIKKFRQKINQRVDELERLAENGAKFEQEENNKRLKAVEAICENTTKSLESSADKIKQLNTSKQTNNLFVELILVEKTIKHVKEKTLRLLSNTIKEYNFKVNEEILNKLQTEESFGTLTHKNLNIKVHSLKIRSRQFSHEGAICVRTSEDKDSCWITGMTLLTPEILIITDYYNKAVKMVDTSSQSVSDQLKLDVEPWDITTVTSTELAGTLPGKQTILFISITSNKLVKKQTILVSGNCHGISCHQGNLVVSFCSPPRFQILDLNGSILKTIDGQNIFLSPHYIACIRNSIYVSDWGMKTVTQLNWQGDVIGSYSGMSYPRRISLSDDGTVFVCDWERNVIEEISGDCSTRRMVLQDLISPWAVSWCGETKKLYYSCNVADEKYGNVLHICKLSSNNTT